MGINQLEQAVMIIKKQLKWNQNRSQKAIALVSSIQAVNAVLRRSFNNTSQLDNVKKEKPISIKGRLFS